MKLINKGKEPNSLTSHRKKSNATYDNYDKDDLRNALVKEQGYICCYCMQRIEPNIEKMKIEHHKSQKKNPELQLNYQNLLGACIGNEGQPKRLQHCDTHKGDSEITINPIDKIKNCEKLIKYGKDGRIYSDDLAINNDLNEILNLNTERLKDHRSAIRKSVNDTITKIKGKKSAWDNSKIQKMLEKYQSKDIEGKYKPYCQVIIFFLKKRLGIQN
ncbi:retron system putative HNH endonuclease [Candidatus Halobeggiatoa sp. HSG11]|nr:retron system putative HNH endonuclease [Candidatus Halobeggiatoa sp. HSG11]